MLYFRLKKSNIIMEEFNNVGSYENPIVLDDNNYEIQEKSG